METILMSKSERQRLAVMAQVAILNKGQAKFLTKDRRCQSVHRLFGASAYPSVISIDHRERQPEDDHGIFWRYRWRFARNLQNERSGLRSNSF